ncbi:hypothetical protein [Streptomyces anulatus]|uniref:hypothetical protein n=1 Tax=Streptomyces anulatus TaxID=1892 RepID=UPI0012FE80CC|nr:hypothetical protein [Streptomyces anulatus]
MSRRANSSCVRVAVQGYPPLSRPHHSRPAARFSFEPVIRGGGQERRQWAGTENAPALVGLGVAGATAARLRRPDIEAAQVFDHPGP